MRVTILVTQRDQRLSQRRGSMLTELIVAAGLLVTSISLLATGAVAGWKLQRLERQQNVAADELSNQLEQLLALSPAAAVAAIAQLEPSSWALQTLPSAELSGELIDDQFGSRIVLEIQWQRIGDSTPLIAVGWLDTAQESLLNQTIASPGDADEE